MAFLCMYFCFSDFDLQPRKSVAMKLEAFITTQKSCRHLNRKSGLICIFLSVFKHFNDQLVMPNFSSCRAGVRIFRTAFESLCWQPEMWTTICSWALVPKESLKRMLKNFFKFESDRIFWDACIEEKDSLLRKLGRSIMFALWALTSSYEVLFSLHLEIGAIVWLVLFSELNSSKKYFFFD